MKVLKNIKESFRRREARRLSVATVQFEDNAMPDPMAIYSRYRFELSFWVDLVGPDAERPDLLNKATKIMAREIYGEVVDRLFEIEGLLMEESYRPPSDPIMTRLRELRKTLQGFF